MTDILLCIGELVAIALNSGCEKVNPNAHSILQDAGAIGFGRSTSGCGGQPNNAS